MREHEKDNEHCWCNPDLYVLCPECDGEEAGCWRCAPGSESNPDGKAYGLVLAGPVIGDEETLIIVHRDK